MQQPNALIAAGRLPPADEVIDWDLHTAKGSGLFSHESIVLSSTKYKPICFHLGLVPDKSSEDAAAVYPRIEPYTGDESSLQLRTR